MHKLVYPAALLVHLGCAPEPGAPDGESSSTSSASASTSTPLEPTTTAADLTTGDTGDTGDTSGEGTASASATTTGGSTSSLPPPAPFCGDGDLDQGEACDDGNQDPFDGCLPDCTAAMPLDPPPLQWKYYEVPGTLCMNGATAGFGISHNPDSNDVMIYLEGGGACFNDVCDFSAFNVPFIPPPDGIFNRSNPQNPVRAWSMIYVPYCTGDIHGGDRDTELGGQLRRFRGYSNVTRYLEAWVPKFADAERVLLTGISAGGFGAGLNAVQVADAFGDDTQIVVIDDSGPPMANTVIPPCLQQTFRDVWGLDDTVLAACGAACSDPNNFPIELIDYTFNKHPNLRFGLFSNTADIVIRGFMSFGYGNGQYDTCDGLPTVVPADVYETGLLDLRAHYGDAASTYFIGQTQILYNFGQGHTVLRSPSFWTTVIDGVPLPQWIAGVIDGDVQHVGP